MKNREIKAKINRAFTKAVPDLRDSVLSSSDQRKEVFIMTNNNVNRSSKWKKLTAYAAAAAVFAFALLGGIYYSNNFVAASAVSIDVNPSVEIKLSKSERVLEVVAHNEDGLLIIDGMDFEGADLDVTVNALIGSMLRQGYISELANSILVSVEGDDEAKTAELLARVAEKIDSILLSESFGGAVLSQTVAKDESLEKLADEYGITVGKVQLINDIINVSPVYSFAELAELSINELNILAGKTGTEILEHVSSKGTASEDSYIGYDAAKAAAFDHAGVNESDAREVETELDYEKGKMVYEIEFTADGVEYDYDINAVTGEVVKSDSEKDDDVHETPNTGTTTAPDGETEGTHTGTSAEAYISRDDALSIAYKHAGVSASDAKNIEVELDVDDGVHRYEIEFTADGVEYDYDVNAVTGTILKSEKETKHKSETDTSTDKSTATDTLISRETALATVYKHAGVSEADVKELECSLDSDDGLCVYEIEFKSAGYEYDYEINAATGDIVKSEKEADD